MKFIHISFNILLVQALYAQTLTSIPIPTQAQLIWQQSELVAVFHYDLHVFDSALYDQPKNRITPISDYNIFNPKRLDTDQWVRAAKDMVPKSPLSQPHMKLDLRYIKVT